MTRTCISLILACALLLPAGAIGAPAKEKGKGKPPDMELLEFLGTFETSDGKIIDPLNIPAHPQEGKAAGKERKKAGGKKTERKKKGESND